MRRADREVTDPKQLEEILRECTAVHIGAQDGAGLFVVPMNYGYTLEGDRLTLYVHSAQEGRKVAAFRVGGTVAFEMDGRHALRTADTACGHSYSYQSIMGSGTIRELTEAGAKRAALGRMLGHARRLPGAHGGVRHSGGPVDRQAQPGGLRGAEKCRSLIPERTPTPPAGTRCTPAGLWPAPPSPRGPRSAWT